MTFTADSIAKIIHGRVDGAADVAVSSFGKIEDAAQGQLSFLANPKYEKFLYTTNASIILVNDSLVLKQNITATLIRVPDSYVAFATLLTYYHEMQQQQMVGIEEPSRISPSAKLGKNVFVGAFSVVGDEVFVGDNVKIFSNVYIAPNVTIGNNVILYPGVTVYHGCTIGNNVIIHSGAIIGSDGFGFAPQADGNFQKMPQIGNVVVEDDVEIGSNTTIDRATMGSTYIRRGVKLDNLIQIAHNVEIDNNTVIAAQAGISGSTKIGKRVKIGGQAGIPGHLFIADDCQISAQSAPIASVKKPGTAMHGSPATDRMSAFRSQILMRQLPEMEKRITALEKLLQKK